VFIDSDHKLVLEDLDDLVEYSGWDGDITVCPWNVLDDRDLHWRKVVVLETTLLGFGPS